MESKTGLNDAFVLTREERDAIVDRAKAGDRSADLLKPFLIGENLKRWHVESDDLWLIYTPKNRIDIDDYPAVRDHLLPYRDRLEKRATKQEWWELQQAQADYEANFLGGKIVYSDITNQGTFSVDRDGYYLANTAYFLPSEDDGLAAYLNSRLAWFYFAGLTNIARGGYLRLRTNFVGQLPLPAARAYPNSPQRMLQRDRRRNLLNFALTSSIGWQISTGGSQRSRTGRPYRLESCRRDCRSGQRSDSGCPAR